MVRWSDNDEAIEHCFIVIVYHHRRVTASSPLHCRIIASSSLHHCAIASSSQQHRPIFIAPPRHRPADQNPIVQLCDSELFVALCGFHKGVKPQTTNTVQFLSASIMPLGWCKYFVFRLWIYIRKILKTRSTVRWTQSVCKKGTTYDQIFGMGAIRFHPLQKSTKLTKWKWAHKT